MEKVRTNNKPQQSIDELQKEFERLCDEQDQLPTEGFAKVFEVLDSLEEAFTPQHPYTENEAAIDKALEITGHSSDEAFCKAFKRNNQIIIEGRKIQAKGLEIFAMEQCRKYENEQSSYNEWQFVPIRIFAPKEIMDNVITPRLEADAKEGKGFYANITDIPEEDESLDNWFDIEAYGIKCSLEPLYRDLQNFGVVDSLLENKTIRDYYLKTIKALIYFIRDNTDKPNRTRNHITKILKSLDDIPAFGLLLQILLLQSLVKWFENVDLKEGDSGYIEACSLINWIGKQLMQKEVRFCFFRWGEDDKKFLKPFCNYLLSTEIGKAVQDRMFKNSIEHNCIIDGENGEKEISQEPQQKQKQGFSKPQSKHPRQQQKSQQARGKGRPKETLKEKMINDADGSKLQKVHTVMNGKKGKDAALIVLACIKKGWMPKPTFTQVAEEFGDIGTQQGFTKYLYEKWFTKDEIEGAINSLD